MKNLQTGLLTLIAVFMMLSGTARAEDAASTAGAAAAQELRQVQEQTKQQAQEHRAKIKEHRKLIKDLRDQRKEAIQAGNKDEAKALHAQIQSTREDLKKNKKKK